MPEFQMRQAWMCDRCGHTADVIHLAAEDSTSVLARIEEQHAIAQEECHVRNGAAGIRMVGVAQLANPADAVKRPKRRPVMNAAAVNMAIRRGKLGG